MAQYVLHSVVINSRSWKLVRTLFSLTSYFAVEPWSLWCLFEAEIRANHAEHERVEECEIVEVANVHAGFTTVR